MIADCLLDILKNSILITGLVAIMMMMIELFNIESRGHFFSGLKQSRVGSVVVGALLGSIPGCMGGFATVSLYTHGMISFGALIAMMIASSGDEAFVMLATMPRESLWIFALLFGIAVIAGVLVDVFFKKQPRMHCPEHYEIHEGVESARHLGWKRAVLFVGVALFIAALGFGMLEHDHADESGSGGINLLSEDWMNIMFAILSIGVLVVLVLASDHFVDEHLWHHIVVKHIPRIFAWTFGVLSLVTLGLHFFDISGWISENTVIMILLATAVGIIPESGPHLIFITLYLSGVVPLPVLFASCISQDGHASLPLLAETKGGFLKAKLINCAVALAVGFTALLFV